MVAREVTWSAFLREPGSVEPLLAQGDVILRRRDGEPLRLSRDAKCTAEHEALAAVARLMSTALSGEGRRALGSHVDTKLPWTRFLPEQDRRAFIDEFLRQFEACADLGDFASLGRVLTEWKNTATLYAEGLAPRLKRPVHAVGPKVRRPG